MENEIRKAIARIEVRDGDRVLSRGTGTLITERLVLTALHVVGDRTKDPPALYEAAHPLVLCFPGHETRGTVLREHFDRRFDWALVECADPPKAAPLPLAELTATGAAWETYGFPDANPLDGMVHAGTVENGAGEIQGVSAMQLFSRQAGAGDGSPVRGLSGGPVVVDGALVGVLRYSLMKEGLNVAGTLYACPVGPIVDRCRTVLPLPDPCWGLPGLPWQDLPPKPFRSLARFAEPDAELFFGRNREIRDLYDRLTEGDGAPIVLLYGQSGVGKSSFLAAGVVPRLRRHAEVVYARRDAGAGLVQTVIAALDPDASSIAEAWNRAEAARGRAVIVLLDQVEEAFTRPNPRLRSELDDFVAALGTVLHGERPRPCGRLVLSFRKEWYPEIARHLETAGLPHAGVFLQRLERAGVVEAIVGLTRSRRLQQQYGLAIEAGLADSIADDLVEDPESAIAPTLQILLTRLWDEATKAGAPRPVFSRALYETLKREGLLLADFLDMQLAQLAERRPAAVEAGLALDVLYVHTTPMLTAAQHGPAELRENYRHLGDEAASLVQDLCDLFLLVGSSAAESPEAAGATSLAHDTLAPLVRRTYARSDKPGQRARRILETRAAEWTDGRDGTPLDERDLAQVERGLAAMRAPTPHEARLIRASLAERGKLVRHRKILRWALRGAVALVVVASVVAARQWYVAVHARRLAELRHAASVARNAVHINPEVGLVRAISATGRSLGHTGGRVIPDVQASLVFLVDEAREQNAFPHGAPVNGVAFTSDGAAVVSGADDGQLRLWTLEGAESARVAAHDGRVTSVAASGAGDGAIASGGADGAVRLWDRSGHPLGPPLRGHRGAVAAVAYRRDGMGVLSGGIDGTLRLWSRGGAALGGPFAAASPVRGVALSPDGLWVASGHQDGTVRIWSVQGDRRRPRVGVGHDGPINAVAFTPDSQLVVTAGEDRTVRRFRLDGRRHGRMLTGHDSAVNALALDPDGQQFATGDQDGTVRRFDFDGNQVTNPFYGPDGPVTSLAYAPASRLIAIGSADGSVRLRDPRGAQVAPIASLEGAIGTVVASPDGRRLAFGARDGGVRVVDVNAHATRTWLPRPAGSHDGRITALAVVADGARIVSGGDDETFRVWDWTGRAIGAPLRTGTKVSALAVSRAGIVAVAGADGAVRLWSLDGTSLGTTLRGHSAPVTAAAFHPDGRTLATGGDDATVRLWRADGTPIGQPLAAHRGGVTSLAFSPDGTSLVSGGADQNWIRWDWTRGRPLTTTRAHIGPVRSVALSPDGAVVASAGQDRAVALRDLEGNLLASFERHTDAVSAVAFVPPGNLIASAGDDGVVWLFRATWREWLTVGCERLRHHPVLRRPATEEAAHARRTCEEHVWSRR